MAEADSRPAFYAAAGGGWRDWWSLLHPPYTLWHLSYVTIGSTLAPEFDTLRFGATLLAFFLALGIAAHALDELNGRPLRTRISDRTLIVAATLALVGAAGVGLVMLVRVGGSVWFVAGVVTLIALGVFLVVGYNLELFGGRLHTDVGFAGAWGVFPVVTAYYAQAEAIDFVALLAGAAAFAISWAQRALSTPARFVRRNTDGLDIEARLASGGTRRFDERFLLEPIESALRALSWGMVLVAVALVLARLSLG